MKQVEFDQLMNQLENEQNLAKRELNKLLDKLYRERAAIRIEVSERSLKLERIGQQVYDLQCRIKAINTTYHDKKHELICKWHEEGEYAHPTARADELITEITN